MKQYEQKVLDLLELSINYFFCFKNYNLKTKQQKPHSKNEKKDFKKIT